MQSFYDEVSIAKNFEIWFKLIYTISWNVSISLSRLVITHYSAVQIVGAGAWKNYKLLPSQRGVVQEIIKIDNLSSTKVTTLGCQVCRTWTLFKRQKSLSTKSCTKNKK